MNTPEFIKQEVRKLPLTHQEDLVKLAGVKTIWQEYGALRDGYAGCFTPPSYKMDRDPYRRAYGVSLIYFNNGVFNTTEIKAASIFTQVRRSKPLTLQETYGLLRAFDTDIKEFLYNFPWEYKTFVSDIPAGERELQIIDPNYFSKYWWKEGREKARIRLEEKRHELKILTPFKQRSDEVSGQPVSKSDLLVLHEKIYLDYQDVIAATLTCLEKDGSENGGSRFEKLYLLKRAQSLTSKANLDISERLNKDSRNLVTEFVANAKTESEPDQIMRDLDPILPEAQHLGFDLSEFQVVAAKSMETVIRSLQEQVNRTENEHGENLLDYFSKIPQRIMRKSILAACGIRDEEISYEELKRDAKKIYLRAWAANYSEREMEFLHQRVGNLLKRFKRSKAPLWKKFLLKP